MDRHQQRGFSASCSLNGHLFSIKVALLVSFVRWWQKEEVEQGDKGDDENMYCQPVVEWMAK